MVRACLIVVAWGGERHVLAVRPGQERMVMPMLLEGKVQTAKIGKFYDSLEVVVADRQVLKPVGGRPQYTCKIVRGWPGVDELRQFKKQGASEQDLEAYSTQIVLPQEDQVLPLVVLDITGTRGFKTLVCEIAATMP